MGERVDIRGGASAGESSPPPIDYGRADPVGDRTRRFRGFFTERIDGVSQFFGEVIGMLGGTRRAGFCTAIACLTGGLGACLRAGRFGGGGWGVFWMTVGGFWLGMYLPLAKK